MTYGLVLLGAALLTPVPPAAAHTDLLASTPELGARLPAPPSRVSLTFTDPVLAQFSQLSVTLGAADPQPLVAEVDGRTVTAPLTAVAPTTTAVQPWTVNYRVVASDGHPVTGAISFTVQTAGATTPADHPHATDPPVEPGQGLPPPTPGRWPYLIGGVATLLGAALLGRRLDQRRRAGRGHTPPPPAETP